jgi:hypothetical protein
MENNQINIAKTWQEIEKIKYPSIFLFNLIAHKNDFDDYDLSIILRIFMKANGNFMLEYNIKKIFKNEVNQYSLTWCVLCDFYKIISKKITLVFILKKFHLAYENKIFWEMKTIDQSDFLINMKERFLSIYDCAKGGTPFHYKLAQLFKESKYNKKEILDDIVSRLCYVLELFGKNIFVLLDIPLITVKDFYELTNENILKYIIIIFEKINELLKQSMQLFDSYNLICMQLNNLLNPSFIKINTVNIDSETEDDDIKLLSIR